MLDERLVYSKTPKGVAEVGSRSGAVSLAARRVLIMIDGKRTVADLAPLARSGEIGAILEQLEAQGLIHAGSSGAQAAPPPSSFATPTPAAPEPAEELPEDRLATSFEAIKRRAVRELSDRLGPDAEVMAVRIETCRSTEELRQRLHEAERLIAGMLGAAQAQEFLRALRRR